MLSPRLTPAGALGVAAAVAAALTGCTTFQTFVNGVPSAAAGASAPAVVTGPGGAASGLRPPGAPPVVAAVGGVVSRRTVTLIVRVTA